MKKALTTALLILGSFTLQAQMKVDSVRRVYSTDGSLDTYIYHSGKPKSSKEPSKLYAKKKKLTGA